ncbi:MAG: PA0069 family radical SAM protein [Vicingaceae bacterium]
MPNDENTVKGRGSQINLANPYLKETFGQFEADAIDDWQEGKVRTKYIEENPQKIINKVYSPDLGFEYSMNPYQGCEHGCVYCYARNTHHYWGYSAGLDFERIIIVKKNAPVLLEKELQHPKWKVSPIMFSGNTDCYQPAERTYGITRSMLKVLLQYRHPVGLITKNDLILRDLDLIKELSSMNLVHVAVSINSLDEKLRLALEPRTASYRKRLKVIEKLSENGIRVNMLIAPLIPGLNSDEIPRVMKAGAEAGASSAAIILARLNGAVGPIFEHWVRKKFPDRADKVMNQIAQVHGGKVNDSRFGKRMRGEGNVALSIHQLFKAANKKYFKERPIVKLDSSIFIRNQKGQLNLFE